MEDNLPVGPHDRLGSLASSGLDPGLLGRDRAPERLSHRMDRAGSGGPGILARLGYGGESASARSSVTRVRRF